MSVNSIYKLLDKLEITVLKGLPIPLTPFVFVHHERVIDILDKVRGSIPGEIQEACGILKRRDDIQAETQHKVSILISEAQQKADKILSESELLRAVQVEADRIRQQVIADCELIKTQAQQEADSIKERALNESNALKEGAERYAESVLNNLEKNLTEHQALVQNGKMHLSRAQSTSTPQPVQPQASTNAYDYQVK